MITFGSQENFDTKHCTFVASLKTFYFAGAELFCQRTLQILVEIRHFTPMLLYYISHRRWSSFITDINFVCVFVQCKDLREEIKKAKVLWEISSMERGTYWLQIWRVYGTYSNILKIEHKQTKKVTTYCYSTCF